MKTVLLFIVLLLACSVGYSQTTFIGNIKDETGAVVPAASIIINKTGTNELIAYSISDKNGDYKITVNSTDKNVDIHVRCIGYATVTETILNISQTKNIILTAKAVELKEVKIKTSSIYRKGDTVNYSVSSFAREQDRSIADVLQRMPGIEILSDGKVLYQGKPINKYYIEGLDLLEGKYNLANQNLPYKEVTTIQILENHQPVKVLESLSFSDKAALNIKLKNKYTFTGQAKAGTGMAPVLWDVNITPMLFMPKRQVLVSYQTNNTGNNIDKQLKTLTIEDLIAGVDINSGKQDWLSIQQLDQPGFDEKRWLFNNIHLFSVNYLEKLRNDYELRINASYLNDYQRQKGITKTLYLLPADTVELLEKKSNNLYFNSLETGVTVQKNTNKIFFKNNTKFQKYWDSQTGNILENQETLRQELNNPYYTINNNFETIFLSGKKLLTLNSIIRISKTPQTLDIKPGQFEELLSNGDPYEDLLQKLKNQTYYTRNSVAFTKGWKGFSFTPNAGFQIEKQSLETRIKTSYSPILPDSFYNYLNWINSKIFAGVQTQYKIRKWKMEFKLPFNHYFYLAKDNSLDRSQKLKRLTFEPKFLFLYDANALWNFSASFNLTNQFGTIQQLYYGYILQDYRTIKRMDSPLPQIVNKLFNGSISYRNPIRSMFWNIIYSRSQNDNNLLYDYKVLENGSLEVKSIEQNNINISHTLTTRASKYFRKTRTNVALSGNFSIQKFQQLINDEIADIDIISRGFGGKIETEATKWFNIEYQGKWTFSNNNIQSKKNRMVNWQNHNVKLIFYPKKDNYINFQANFIENNLYEENSKYFFADLFYRYSLKKKNIDFEAHWNNIFNNKNYETINIMDFNYTETNFQLRPSQFLVSVRFAL